MNDYVRIFVPSWRRPTSMTTPALLSTCGVSCTVIVRSTEADAYKMTLRGTGHKLMVIGPDDDLTAAREAARKKLKRGEWCLQMDDNVLGFIQPKTVFYRKNQEIKLEAGETMITRTKWQPTMNVNVSFTEFYELVVSDTLREAEKRGAYLCGFSAHENPAFRGKKYSDVAYVCGKAMLMRNQGLLWKQSTESSGEDYALTAAHLYQNGRVLVNRWGHPLRRHYMPGGCGPYEERLPAMLRAQKELSGRYGDVFGIKNANAPDKKQGELRVRFNTLEQVEAWRSALRAQGVNPNVSAGGKRG